jgi:Ala-tRNA(Pro) deacylase
MHIAEFLAARQVAFESLQHPPAFTAQKLAKYLRVKGERVAKGVLLRGPSGFVLAVLSATHRVDLEAVAAYLDGPVRVASAEEAASVFRDCEWGVVPAFGNLYGLPTLLDESLRPEAVLVVEAHTHVEAVRLRCADFELLAGPVRLRFARKGQGW